MPTLDLNAEFPSDGPATRFVYVVDDECCNEPLLLMKSPGGHIVIDRGHSVVKVHQIDHDPDRDLYAFLTSPVVVDDWDTPEPRWLTPSSEKFVFRKT